MRPSLVRIPTRALTSALAFGVAALLCACPKRPPGLPEEVSTPVRSSEPEATRTRAEQIASEVDAMLDAQNLQLWRAWTEGAPMDLAATYRGREGLFSPESIATVARARDAATDERERRGLSALHLHLVGEYLSQRLAATDEAIASLEASLTFPIGEVDVRWRDVERKLAAEPSARKRRALYEGAALTGARLAPLSRRRSELLETELQALGYPEAGATLAFAAQLRQSDFARLEALAEGLLTITQKPYRTVMDRLARRELGHAFDRATRADIPRLFRKSQVDDAFPADASVERALRTLAGFGMPLESLPALELDARDVPEKNGRPLAVVIGRTVRLSVKPAVGIREQASVLRELGHALALLPIARRSSPTDRLGNAATLHGFGVLFSDLTEDPIWLEEFAGLSGERRARYLSSANAHRLYLVRQVASRLLYQLALLREEIPLGTNAARQLLKGLMERADGLKAADIDVLWAEWSLGDLVAEADSLRAAFLAAQLQSELKARGGPAWWRNPEAGELLQRLLEESVGRTPREIATSLGASGLQVDSLLLRMSAALGVPIQLPGPGQQKDVE